MGGFETMKLLFNSWLQTTEKEPAQPIITTIRNIPITLVAQKY